jgi:hypothetical protein
VEANFYLTAKQVSRWIQDTYSIRLSPSAVARLLDRLGFSYKKTKLVPAKADAAKQEAHIKDFEALMANKPVDTLVFFNDGVHPQHNTRSEYAWIRKGKEYEMPSNLAKRDFQEALNFEHYFQAPFETMQTMFKQIH